MRSQLVLHPAKDELAELAAKLEADGYCQCVDLCAVDYLTSPDRLDLPADIAPQRFEVVAVFITHGINRHSIARSGVTSGVASETTSQGNPSDAATNDIPATNEIPDTNTPHRIRVRVQVPEDDPNLPSLTRIYPGTENMEREIYDMFGISFLGNPDLTRILMPDEWQGHPLRRDYAVGQVPVQFKGAPS